MASAHTGADAIAATTSTPDWREGHVAPLPPEPPVPLVVVLLVVPLVVVLLVVLLVVLGSLRAALMPVISALVGAGVAVLIIVIAAGVIPIMSTTLLLCMNAQAALGRAPQAPSAASVEPALPVARQMRAVPPSEAYTVSTIVAPTGTVVQEFVNAQQVVFAVVWQGPVLPDLAAFFGDHYVAFQRAAKERRAAGQ